MRLLIPAILLCFLQTIARAQGLALTPDTLSSDTLYLIRPDLGSAPSEESVARPDLSGDIYATPINKSLTPRVFKGYRNLLRPWRYTRFPDPEVIRTTAEHVWCKIDTVYAPEFQEISGNTEEADSAGIMMPDLTGIPMAVPDREDLPVAFGSVIPDWLRRSVATYRFQEDFVYSVMVSDPWLIEYADWNLPEPPRLPAEDYSLRGYLKRLNLPELEPDKALPVHANGERINWLHTFNIALQLSQAYVSANWYQGGNSYLAFLANFLWDVSLNNVYYPKLIFQSTLSYKLSVNSTPDDECHEYSISQDQFQYNLKFGYKAVHNWYYSFLAQFKTQFFNSYPANSMARSASFLSPGELNLGLGMTYSKENAKKTLRFSASVSPASYNLKTCIDRKVDHAQFGIRPDRKWVNEFGSNAEVNFYARLWGNTTYTTRLFLFTDYKTFLSDWENTLNFQFSRLFSTQIYAHLRYDTSADSSVSRKWRKLMLKEILSVGISYTFSTK